MCLEKPECVSALYNVSPSFSSDFNPLNHFTVTSLQTSQPVYIWNSFRSCSMTEMTQKYSSPYVQKLLSWKQEGFHSRLWQDQRRDWELLDSSHGNKAYMIQNQTQSCVRNRLSQSSCSRLSKPVEDQSFRVCVLIKMFGEMINVELKSGHYSNHTVSRTMCVCVKSSDSLCLCIYTERLL